MSTKTLRKRIALVAVSALGAGVLSVAPANAAIEAGDLDLLAATTQPGVCAADPTTSSQAVVVQTGSTFKADLADAANGEAIYIKIAGNITFSSVPSTITGSTATSVTDTTIATSDSYTFLAGAVGTGTISISLSSTDSVLEVISVTIVASCSNKKYDAASSYFYATTQTLAQDGTAAATNIDTVTSSIPATLIASNGSGYISLALADAYTGALNSKALVATVTSGDAYVSIEDGEDGSVPAEGNSKTAITASTGEKAVIRVDQITSTSPTVATVVVTHDGVTVGTKTFTFEGQATSIVVSDVTIGQTGANGYFRYLVKDAAGNALRSRAVANDTTANAPASVSAVSSGLSVAGTTSALGEKSAAINGTNILAGSVAAFGCTAAGGSTTIGIKYTESVTNVVKASIPVLCSDVLDTWTASLDKASYSPGELATLTITGKDEKGRPVYSLDTLADVAVSLPQLTAVTTPTSTDTFTSGAGIKKYTFTVGTTEGSFAGTVLVTGETDDTAKALSYAVKSTSTAVSNADVLKAIVSLIASINKQIAALQKALLRR
jgi:hypothetical protein